MKELVEPMEIDNVSWIHKPMSLTMRKPYFVIALPLRNPFNRESGGRFPLIPKRYVNRPEFLCYAWLWFNFGLDGQNI